LIEELTPLCAWDVPVAAGARPSSADHAAGAEADGAQDMPATRLVPDLAFWIDPDGAGTDKGGSSVTPSGLGAEAAPSETELKGEPAPAEARGATPVPPAVGAGEVGEPAAAGDDSAPLDAGLIADWRQWAAVVDLVAGGGKTQDVSAPAYRDLRGRLLTSCRAALATARGARREVLQQLETLVEPWLAPQALAAMDPEALASLLLRCRQLDSAIGGAGHNSVLWRWAALFGTVFAALFLAGWLCRQHAWIVQARSWAGSLVPLVKNNPVVATGVLLPLVVLAAICLLPRLFRA
jgi:hypothetical protein